jgi:transglutaminase-like putative cysteine protease
VSNERSVAPAIGKWEWQPISRLNLFSEQNVAAGIYDNAPTRTYMHIRAGYEIAFRTLQPTPMILMLAVHPSRDRDLLTKDEVRSVPSVPMRQYRDGFGNKCTRVVAPVGLTEFRSDLIVWDSGLPDEVAPGAQQHPVDELPEDTLIYLLGSRYCDTQKLSDFAWQKFGATAPGWERVKAICDFVHDHITFGYAHARDDRTASDGFQERVGVCRDFTQLAITLCRCMNIPARYCTGYLGDIGVDPDPAPMDFSAWFEVYLGKRWFTFDARHNRPRIGRVVIARGRDAADVAISTSFGSPAHHCRRGGEICLKPDSSPPVRMHPKAVHMRRAAVRMRPAAVRRQLAARRRPAGKRPLRRR